MYQKGTRKGTAQFRIKAPAGAQTVLLAGDFNNWKPVTMARDGTGTFTTEVPVSKPVCQYKFVVDGKWMTDPDHSNFARNPFGTMNSVANLAGA